MSGSSEFQSRGAERLKALLTMVTMRARGTERWTEEADLREREGVAMWRSSDRYGGEMYVMKGLECKQEDFEVNMEFDGEPVELLQNRGNVVNGGGSGDDPSCRVLNHLKFM